MNLCRRIEDYRIALAMLVFGLQLLTAASGLAKSFELSEEQWKARCPAIITWQEIRERRLSFDAIRIGKIEYPPLKLEAVKPGQVILQVRVDPEGAIVDINVVMATAPDFEASALKAVRRWKYPKPWFDGHPTCAEAELDIKFRIFGEPN